ncbi:putative RNA processing endonuclease 1 [Trypanosoma cruzi]|uniref:Uncharacterized protein n=2 Tax=Trypanosoma cruzi TaxID=5693 RepID=Q4D2M1_TRYCC|nr:hypothetical protein, conserved [Trypanosoma cruzi]EAN86779.1 hypothetical protein, conserved [Trypanosoma cruzi]KAF8275997.1 putative RNA processing endonuclease 1 [Trypanosoma cruzi]PWV19378.1 putative RNA processing endonuclease 1 [Trypanosoma cruzi]|eukprot:XP_808630.1 hypothetical protein [Trypanosoma cruzi strain CL Brener]
MLQSVRRVHPSLFFVVPMRLKGTQGIVSTATSHGKMSHSLVSAPQPTSRMPEEFFLPPNSNRCRLCGEVQFRGLTHTGSVLHQSVESIMWLLVARAKRHPSGAVGVSPEASSAFFLEETRRWERVLGHSSCFTLVPHMQEFGETETGNEYVTAKCSPDMAPENLWRHLMGRKASQLREKLHALMELGLLKLTTPNEDKTDPNKFYRDAGFQRMECIGDHNWGHSVCHRLVVLFPEVNWRTLTNTSVVDALRTVLESNQHLDYVFTALRLDEILRNCGTQKISTKLKADVIEAIAGELHVALWSLEPYDTDGISTRFSMHGATVAPSLAFFVRVCLNELMDIILYCHMAKYNVPLVRAVVELCRREAYLMDWLSSPYYALSKSRRWRSSTNGRPRWILPSPPPLHNEPQPQCCGANTHIAISWAYAPVPVTTPDEIYDTETVLTDGLLQETKRPLTAAVERHNTWLAARELMDTCDAFSLLSRTQT